MSTPRATSTTILVELLLERAGTALCLVAPDGTVLHANPGWLRYAGRCPEDVIGARLGELVPDCRDMVAMQARARAGHHAEVPRHARRLDGRETWWEGSIDPAPLDGGTGLLVAVREVAAADGPPGAPREEGARPGPAPGETLLARLVERIPVMVAIYEPRLRSFRLNAEFRRVLGWSEEDAAAGDLMERCYPDPALRATAAAHMAAAGATWREFPVVAKDGAVVPSSWTNLRLADDTQVGIGIDLRERRGAEEELRAGEARLRQAHERFAAAVQASPVVVFTQDAELRYTWIANPALGYAVEEVLGKTDHELFERREDADRLVALKRRVLEGGAPAQAQLPVLAAGVLRWYDVHVQPQRSGGAVVGIIATAVDISDRKNAEDGVREANERLREASRRKDEFLGMLSHELRNPLAPIRNAAYVLEQADPNGEEAARARGVLRRQTEHLTRLVDDLLDVSRITQGKITLRRARLDLRDAVARAAEEFRGRLADRGIELRTGVPAGEVWVDADPTRLHQVLVNLLHNASKFTRGGDQVTLTLASSEGAAEIRLRDTGAGIEPALLASLFDPFVQGERTLARSEGGLGLGLALVKGIVELHGGTVRAASEGIGKGAEFTVRWPLDGGRPAGLEARAPAARRGGGRRVLIIDDNVDAADSLADLLRLQGYEVEVAYDGQGALSVLEPAAPDVVLCDIGLPDMTGYDVARAVRARGSRVRLIALTGYAQADDLRRAREAGFDSHLAKPPDLGELMGLLAERAPPRR